MADGLGRVHVRCHRYSLPVAAKLGVEARIYPSCLVRGYQKSCNFDAINMRATDSRLICTATRHFMHLIRLFGYHDRAAGRPPWNHLPKARVAAHNRPPDPQPVAGRSEPEAMWFSPETVSPRSPENTDTSDKESGTILPTTN